MENIPVFDMRSYTEGGPNDRARFVEGFVGEGLRGFGFVRLTGHPVVMALVTAAYLTVDRLFSFSDEDLQKYEHPEIKNERGYTRLLKEKAVGYTQANPMRYWMCARDFMPEESMNLGYFLNVWPEEVPEFRIALSELNAAYDRVDGPLGRAIAEYYDAPPEEVAGALEYGDSVTRVIEYVSEDMLGSLPEFVAAPHADLACLTFMPTSLTVPDDGSGDDRLEIRCRDGSWLPVRAAPGELVVNAGQKLAFITNDDIPATMHRVRRSRRAYERRFSLPSFRHFLPRHVMRVLASCVGPNFPPPREPVMSRTFTERGLAQNLER